MSQSGIFIGEDPGVFKWDEITAAAAQMINGHGYIANRATLVTLTLPAAADVGEIIRVCGKGAGGWRIAQNALQQIHYGNVSTTIGVGGRIDFVQRRDAIELVCTTANTEWTVLSSIGVQNVT